MVVSVSDFTERLKNVQNKGDMKPSVVNWEQEYKGLKERFDSLQENHTNLLKQVDRIITASNFLPISKEAYIEVYTRELETKIKSRLVPNYLEASLAVARSLSMIDDDSKIVAEVNQVEPADGAEADPINPISPDARKD
jgi:hypothetical protein